MPVKQRGHQASSQKILRPFKLGFSLLYVKMIKYTKKQQHRDIEKWKATSNYGELVMLATMKVNRKKFKIQKLLKLEMFELAISTEDKSAIFGDPGVSCF